MNTIKLVSAATLALSAFTISATEMQVGSTTQQSYGQNSSQPLQIWEKSSIHFVDSNKAPHWTDSLRKNSLIPTQAMGVEYGRDYGVVGAVRPAAEETLGPVSIYFRATF
ncbi:MAG TPA: hypothetical protein EYH06_13810 [Chromatiales bacterium]|nr:hypothetical protein [Thiotrichales bacterium]HIP69641.1 hypothetical protein [Chromatiales bacterium]